jgi:hypothetical protein
MTARSRSRATPAGRGRTSRRTFHEAATAYLTVDFHQVNSRDPFVYKTGDYGKTWKAITNGIPRSMLSYAHCIREDPVRRGLLYLGTENGVYVSFDDGEIWQPLQMNLPHAPAYWLVVQEQFNDLVLATYGRGFWILDDITPLRQLTPQTLSADALFRPRDAYRFREITPPNAVASDPTVGQDPPYGASITYYLTSAPSGNVTLTVSDQQGTVVRTLNVPRNVGLNRVYWDLRYEPTKEVRLRTSPVYAPDVKPGPEGWRLGGQRFSMLAPPGTYTVKLSTGGREMTEQLVVRKDPNSGGSEAEITEQTRFLSELRASIERAADVINTTEIVRSQLQGLPRILPVADLTKAAADLEKKFTDLEMQLVELRATGRGQDGVRFGARLYQKLGYLANGLMSNDYRPTAQQLEVKTLLEQQLRAAESQLDTLLKSDLGGFNDLLRQRNISNIVVPASRKSS